MIADVENLQDTRNQRIYAVDRALKRYAHEMGLAGVGTDEERIIELMVSLLHWCDERNPPVILEDALHQAERVFVDELGEDQP